MLKSYYLIDDAIEVLLLFDLLSSDMQRIVDELGNRFVFIVHCHP